MASNIDVRVHCHGTIFIVMLDSQAARSWVEEHVETSETQWWGETGMVVEHRYIGNLVDGMIGDGLKVA